MEICEEHGLEGIAYPDRDGDCPICSEINDLRNEVSDLEERLGNLNDEISSLNDRVCELESDVDYYEGAVDEQESIIEELKEELRVPLISIVERTIHGNPE